MNIKTEHKLREKLEILAGQDIESDNADFIVCDYTGGNIDDAYSMGLNEGETLLARQLIEEFFDGSL